LQKDARWRSRLFGKEYTPHMLGANAMTGSLYLVLFNNFLAHVYFYRRGSMFTFVVIVYVGIVINQKTGFLPRSVC
jgi:hypothetical protein